MLIQLIILLIHLVTFPMLCCNMYMYYLEMIYDKTIVYLNSA